MDKFGRYIKDEQEIVGAGTIRIVIPVSRGQLFKMTPEEAWKIVRDDAVAAARQALEQAFFEERGLIVRKEID